MLQNGGNLHSTTQMGIRYFKWSLEVKMYFLIEKTFKYFCLKQQASHKNGFRSLLQKMLYSVHLGRGIIIATIDHAGECAADTEHSGDTPHAHCHNHNIIYHIKSVYKIQKKAEHGTLLSLVLSSVHYILDRYPYSKYRDPLHVVVIMFISTVMLSCTAKWFY